MASLKLATLAIRTIAKPISTRLKQEAREHPFFRRICVQLAQSMYSAEMRLGTFVLGQPPKAIKPLSETKAIESGASFIAESFLFFVAASLIVAETWRSSLKESRRREGVAEGMEELRKGVEMLSARVGEVERVLRGGNGEGAAIPVAIDVGEGDVDSDVGRKHSEEGLGLEGRVRDVEQRSEHLTRVVERLVSVGINAGSNGWLALQGLNMDWPPPRASRGRRLDTESAPSRPESSATTSMSSPSTPDSLDPPS